MYSDDDSDFDFDFDEEEGKAILISIRLLGSKDNSQLLYFKL